MKNFLCLIVTLATALSLSACGNQNEVESVETDPIIETTTVLAATTIPETTASTPTFSKVDITMDNWEKYFEINLVTNWRKNAFEEIDGFGVVYMLQLKEEFAFDVSHIGSSPISLECTATPGHYFCECDFENKTYTLGEENPSVGGGCDEGNITFKYTLNDIMTGHAFLHVGEYFNERKTLCLPENFELLRIKGTISVLDK